LTSFRKSGELFIVFVALLFLRFQQKAATRFINYWQEKFNLWGEERASRTITIGDFGEEDQEALLRGGIQSLNETDRFNRGIILSDRYRFDHRPTHRKSMVRTIVVADPVACILFGNSLSSTVVSKTNSFEYSGT
jgi:hypothetical protein